jgi:hypothetical protein
MKTCNVLLAAGLATIQAAGAGEFTTGFGTEYNHGGQVAGQHDWTIDDPTPDLSFFVRLNGSDAAAFGGFFDVPAGPRVRLSHPVGLPLAGSSFRVSMAVLPSTLMYPGRDTFGWSLTDPAGATLFSLHFIPSVNNPDILNILWSSAGGGAAISTGKAISYSAPYTFDLKFNTIGVLQFGFSAVISGSNSFSFDGSLPGLGGKTWHSLSADFIGNADVYGDNYMIFDDVAAATQPIVDLDGDGYSAEAEAWFGTSDSSNLSIPAPGLSFVSGAPVLTFPSVPGNAYLVEVSDDLSSWSSAGSVTAIGITTPWLDPAPVAGRRFFRVRKP